MFYNQQYRFLVIRSSQHDDRKLRKRDNRVKREHEIFEKATLKLGGKQFACQPDAEMALKDFKKEHRLDLFAVAGSVEQITVPEKRPGPGRPSKNEPRSYRKCYQVTASIELNQDYYERAKEKLSCFVLISNHPDLSAKDILIEYRNQSVVENRFKFIKDPIYIGPLHLKRKDRLEALCYVALIALALYMILQIRVRNALKNESEPVVLAGKKKSFSPTANKILELFASIKVLWLNDGQSIERQLPQRYSKLRRVLNMAGFDLDIFTSPP